MFDELARLVNFRDLGGHRTNDGRAVRKGLLYRSAVLWELTPAQLEPIRALNIRSIVDLRANEERSFHPMPWREMGCKDYWFHDYDAPARSGLNALLDDESRTSDSLRTMMLGAYRAMPYGQVDGIRRVFQTISDDEAGYLFHCTSGKDRTGIAAALLLHVLDVPRETIVADYLATLKFDILNSPAYRRDSRPLSEARAKTLKPIYTVQAEYIGSMFDGLIERDGSVEGFLRQTVGVTDAQIAGVRKRLLG